jgi:CheY-like chemotaxis protein
MVMGVSVLLVDDEPDLRFILRRCFDAAGYEVFEAEDGVAALLSVRQARPDVVVTDLMMPTMDGFELIRRLRADPMTAGILIIVVSSDWATAAGADAALAKPFEVKDVLALADNLINDGGGDR